LRGFGFGSAAAGPLVALAQPPAVPVVGFLNGVSFQAYANKVAAFRQGLNDEGFFEGRNVAIEYHSADGHPERLPATAADLVGRQVGVIVAIGAEARRWGELYRARRTLRQWGPAAATCMDFHRPF
jgi:putative tryptophan/tyrosine transport system substrate-binding protein